MGRIPLILCAILLDLLIGDPESWPHPVRAMGSYIVYFKRRWIRDSLTANQKLIRGSLLWVSLVVMTLTVVLLVTKGLAAIHEGLADIWSLYLFYSGLSIKSLAQEARRVQQALRERGLIAGRQQVARIVGRQTDQLSQEEVIKATVETVAENTCDGVIAPLFYGLLFGPAGMMVYKAVNTMDSMLGYRSPAYEHLGKPAALMDDGFNYLPARLGALFMVFACWLLNYQPQKAVQILIRDRRQHASPNAGYAEAVVAGALGLQLGGGHYYHGQWVDKASIGDYLNQASLKDITRVNRILYLTSGLVFVLLGLIQLLCWKEGI